MVNADNLTVDNNLENVQITGNITNEEVENKHDVVDSTQDKNLQGEKEERKEVKDVSEGLDSINSNTVTSENDKEFKIFVEHVEELDKDEQVDEVFFDSQSELMSPSLDSVQERMKEIKSVSMRGKQSHLLSESCVSIESDVTYHRDSEDELNQLEISEFVASYMAENNGEKAKQPHPSVEDVDFYLNENKDDSADDFNDDLDIEQARLSILGTWDNASPMKQVESSVSDALFVSASESVGELQDDNKVDVDISIEGKAAVDIPVFSREFDEVFNSVPEPRPEFLGLVGDEKEKCFVKDYVMGILEKSVEKVQSEMDESLLVKRVSLTAENIDIRISKRHYSEDLVDKISPCITRSLSRGSVDILSPITALKTDEIDEEDEEQEVEFVSYKLNTDAEMVLTSLPESDSAKEHNKLPVISGFGVCYTGNDADADVEEIGAYRAEVVDLNSNICSEVIPVAVQSIDTDDLINAAFDQNAEQYKEEKPAILGIDDKIPDELGSSASNDRKLQNSDNCNADGEHNTDNKLEQHMVVDEKNIADKLADSKAETQADAIADKQADSIVDKQADSVADKQVDSIEDKKADSVADKQADSIADDQADSVADKPADSIADEQADSIADEPADSIADDQAESVADKQADSIADEQADSVADKPADSIVDEQADSIADKPADSIADKPADSVADKLVDSVADKPVDSIADQLADIVADKQAQSIVCNDVQPTATENDDGQQTSTVGEDQMETTKVNKLDKKDEGAEQHVLREEDKRVDQHGLIDEGHTDTNKSQGPETNRDEQQKREAKEIETTDLDECDDEQEVNSETRSTTENEHGTTESMAGMKGRQNVTKDIDTTDLDDYDGEENTVDKNVQTVSSVKEDTERETVANTGDLANDSEKRNSVQSNESKDAIADMKEEEVDKESELPNVTKISQTASASTSGNDDDKNVGPEQGSLDKKKSKRKGSKKPDKKNSKDEKKNSKEECCVS